MTRNLPWWGWAGLALGVSSWVLAWTRYDWFLPFQPYTFTPLWAAYVIVVNALTFRRTGQCMLTAHPGLLARLSGVSAIFWWFFEYLNRFVQNWHYVGIDTFSPAQYCIFATLPFATVLPAVQGTYELLETTPRFATGAHDSLRIQFRRPKLAATVTLLVFSGGLAAIGIWPDYLFALLWIAPVLIIISLQSLMGETTAFSDFSAGRWRRPCLYAVAALICGLFWEMWNYFSLAKWIYSIPFVSRYYLFEMPLLGFAGYLPFGLECAVISDLVTGRHTPYASFNPSAPENNPASDNRSSRHSRSGPQ